jgi:hypothetical protein
MLNTERNKKMEKVEFRIKQEGIKWEDTPVDFTSSFFSRSGIDYFAKQTSKIHQAEVRWNFEGLSQGHYVNASREEVL